MFALRLSAFLLVSVGNAAVIDRVPAVSASLLPSSPALVDVRVREILPNILHLEFPSQHLMASTLLRFQEHYESPKFRGRHFDLETFMDWYAGTKKHGNFSYLVDWDGFNFPSSNLAPFRNGEFDPLTRKETALLEIVRGRPEPFYVIGTRRGKDGPATLRHEIAHGLYTTNSDYRIEAQELLKKIDLQPVYRMLERLGYHPSVWLDEAHAWLGDPAWDLIKRGVNAGRYHAVKRNLLRLYRKFAAPMSADARI